MRRAHFVGVVLALTAGQLTAFASATSPVQSVVAPCRFEFGSLPGEASFVPRVDGHLQATAAGVSSQLIVSTRIDCQLRFYRAGPTLCDLLVFSVSMRGPAAELFTTVKLPALCGTVVAVDACMTTTWQFDTGASTDNFGCRRTYDDGVPYLDRPAPLAGEQLVLGGLLLVDTTSGSNNDGGLMWQAYGVLAAWNCSEPWNEVATVTCTPPPSALVTEWYCAYWVVVATAQWSGHARASAQCTDSPWVRSDPVSGGDLPAVGHGPQFQDVDVLSVTCSAYDESDGFSSGPYVVACADPDTARWLLDENVTSPPLLTKGTSRAPATSLSATAPTSLRSGAWTRGRDRNTIRSGT